MPRYKEHYLPKSPIEARYLEILRDYVFFGVKPNRMVINILHGNYDGALRNAPTDSFYSQKPHFKDAAEEEKYNKDQSYRKLFHVTQAEMFVKAFLPAICYGNRRAVSKWIKHSGLSRADSSTKVAFKLQASDFWENRYDIELKVFGLA